MSYTEYSCSRLTFKACIIESLKENDVFCIKTPVGSFQMTKGDFYKSFPNVIQTKSYREQGVYSYTKTPQKANKYLFEQNDHHNSKKFIAQQLNYARTSAVMHAHNR
jgi:hypothetical protein